jgi:hypothetical protein
MEGCDSFINKIFYHLKRSNMYFCNEITRDIVMKNNTEAWPVSLPFSTTEKYRKNILLVVNIY